MQKTFKIKAINSRIDFSSEYSKATLREFLRKREGKTLYLTLDERTPARSETQNNALHLWFELVAKELNDGGLHVQKVLEQTIEINWNKDLVKNTLWRPVQVALLKKKSTTELKKTEDIDVVYEHLNRYLSDKFGLHVPFPNWEDKDEAVLLEDL